MNELMKRILIGAIGIPLAVVICYLGSYYFFGAILIISILSQIEFVGFGIAKGYNPLKWESVAAVIIIEITIFMFLTSTEIVKSLGLIIVIISEILLIFPLLFAINLIKSKENSLINVSVTMSGLIYTLIPFFSLLTMRLGNVFDSDIHAFSFIMIYFATIWLCDSAAYFIGKPFGRHKIAPKISPKKSWEGGIAGFLFAMLSFFSLGYYFQLPFNVFELLAFGLVIGSLGQFGDFIESGLKRDAGVKDSSNILSAHGGILDRFDSIMYTAPFVLILLQIFLN